jgi:hypothetical protein
MGIQFTNNAVALTTAAIGSVDTTMTVTTGWGVLFPSLTATDYFYLTLVSTTGSYEIVKVTARTDDTFTIVRAQESTMALPFPANSRAELRITAATIRALISDAEDYLLL